MAHASDESGEGVVRFERDTMPVVPAMIEFIRSATYEEKRQIVAAHPELRWEMVDRVIERMAAAHRQYGDEASAATTESWGEFLVHLRMRNFDYAVAKGVMTKIFVEMPNSPGQWNAYLRGVAAREVYLQNAEGDRAIAELASDLRDELPSVAAAIEGFRSLVKQHAGQAKSVK
jgi:hypothetical protein